MPSPQVELKVVSVACEQLSPGDATTVVSEVVKSTLYLRGLLPALYDDLVAQVRHGQLSGAGFGHYFRCERC
jgi:hypothetical protein